VRFPLVFHVSTVVFAQPVLRLVLARDTQFYICSPTGEQGPGPFSLRIQYHTTQSGAFTSRSKRASCFCTQRYVRSWH
jgi:hypothetical protein